VEGVGKGFIVGGREEQVRVEVMPERLSGYGISLQQVAQTIKTANAEKTAGEVESGGLSFSVRTGSFLTSAREIGRLVIGMHAGAPVYVRDVARVSQEPAEPSHMVTFYTGPAYEGDTPEAHASPAVTVAVAKKEGTNGVTIAKRILKKVDELKGDLIPSNVHVTVTRDYGKSADDKVNELLSAMAEAALIVSVLCLVGLGVRAAIVVIAVIPVVILLTIWWAMISSPHAETPGPVSSFLHRRMNRRDSDRKMRGLPRGEHAYRAFYAEFDAVLFLKKASRCR